MKVNMGRWALFWRPSMVIEVAALVPAGAPLGFILSAAAGWPGI